ncbi:uncharacterized protein BDW43DRAFT_259917 [Aspergillus alliaceus]|uniref:uncharacterized protein n=1 Tax=Petromyces alliaceus TaxID=209559 RepID=UPI0012A4AC76|nr:uncharacterized protein BDW43DRAFT_259917 [Aspergillus alliaceus]KAB8238843.1 hypothetical protein BDW43DRAFT_259917 [Aspergillus alliaceus]
MSSISIFVYYLFFFIFIKISYCKTLQSIYFRRSRMLPYLRNPVQISILQNRHVWADIRLAVANDPRRMSDLPPLARLWILIH